MFGLSWEIGAVAALVGVFLIVGMLLGWTAAQSRLTNMSLKERQEVESALSEAMGIDVAEPHQVIRVRRGVNAVVHTLLFL